MQVVVPMAFDNLLVSYANVADMDKRWRLRNIISYLYFYMLFLLSYPTKGHPGFSKFKMTFCKNLQKSVFRLHSKGKSSVNEFKCGLAGDNLNESDPGYPGVSGASSLKNGVSGCY